ncbi:MAG TPA: hypothetical protein VJK50_04300 [Patescibacteria group bacterium]|nr:hypothetical protein [Patescibacteria group bacterium]
MDAIAMYRIIESANKVVNRVLALCADRTGGYFCLVDPDSGFCVILFRIGTVAADKGQKYYSFAQEKALRLRAHPEHRSSWQSRNPDQSQWGGAVKAKTYIFSFSGLPELADEAAMLELAVDLGELDLMAAFHLARISDNDFFAQLHPTSPTL